MIDEQLGLDTAAAEQTVVSVFRQIVAVLASRSNAAIDDVALFHLANTLFAAFARAGEDGLTTEQIKAACAAFPDELVKDRLSVLKGLGAIQPAFDKPYQREYRASFTSYVSMLFVQRMLARGGQSELHQLLTMEKIRLEGGESTTEEALEVVVGITTALRLLVAELVALTVSGTVENLRERAPLLWNAKSLIDQASAVHEILLQFWPALSRKCGELRSAIAAYEDASTNASARLMAAAGTSRALNLLPPRCGSASRTAHRWTSSRRSWPIRYSTRHPHGTTSLTSRRPWPARHRQLPTARHHRGPQFPITKNSPTRNGRTPRPNGWRQSPRKRSAARTLWQSNTFCRTSAG